MRNTYGRDKNLRNPLIAWIYALSILFLLSAGVSWMIKSAYFPVKYKKIESKKQGFKHLNIAYLQAVAKNSIDNNIFHVNLNRVKAEFEHNPWVKNANVWRVWPDTVIVEIEERVPVARWQKTQLIDEDGTIFSASTNINLPSLEGPKNNEKNILLLYQQASEELAKVNLTIEQFSCNARLSCQMRLQNGILVKLGREHIAQRVARLRHFWYSIFQPQASNLAYIDLRYQDAFVIKEQESIKE